MVLKMEDRFIGKRLDGRYEIHELVGVGGMAYVYRAYDRMEDRWVAIKILKEEFSNNSDFLRRFRNESKAIAVLSHPNIVKIYDVSLGDQIQYIVMEFIDGVTLKEYIEQQGTIRWQEAAYFMIQILDALENAHAKGIIHRDIKPQNIILLRDGTIKVTDFGIARFSQSETQTMTDKAIGTVHYISPEQARGDYITGKADLYSVGVMLYEMLTGTLPFMSDNAVSVALMQLQTKPRMLREINPNVPKGLEQITMKAMEKNPADRFNTAGEMLDDIEAFRKNPSIVFGYDYISSDYKAQQRDISNYDTMNYSADYDDSFEYEEELIKSKRRRKGSMAIRGIVIAAIVIMIGAGAVVGMNMWREMQNKEPEDVEVPNFVGKIYATEIMGNSEYANFQIKTEPGNNPDYGPGVVVSQNPTSGKKVKVNREIILMVNPTAEPTATVPALVGFKQDDAYSTLKNLNLEGKIEIVFDDEVEVGIVIRTDPVEGSVVPEGSVVTVYVSKGPSTQKVTVPENLSGDTLENVKQKLTEAGLTIGVVTSDDSSKLEEGTVISTNPQSGAKISEGQAVDIHVSSGKGASKVVDFPIPLPQVDEEVTIKIYRDGAKIDELVMNPSYNNTYQLSLTGTTGVSDVVIVLNEQDYMYIEYNFDDKNARIISQNEYVPSDEGGSGNGSSETGGG